MAPNALRASSDSIELRDISKAFGSVRAVGKVCPGAVVALLSRNGAGKSTLVKCRPAPIPSTAAK